MRPKDGDRVEGKGEPERVCHLINAHLHLPLPLLLVGRHLTHWLIQRTATTVDTRTVLVLENHDAYVLGMVNDVIAEAESAYGANLIRMDVRTVQVDREYVDENYEKVCAQLYKGISIILDMTWTGWDKLRELAHDFGIIYKRGDMIISPYVQAIDDIMMFKNTTDIALIFQNEKELNQTLYYLIGNSIIRLVVIDYLSPQTVKRIGSMRPLPSYYAIYANTKQMEELFKTAADGGLVRRNGLWHLVFMDNNYAQFSYFKGISSINVTINALTMKEDVCCHLMYTEVPCNCPPDFNIFEHYFRRLVNLIVEILSELQSSNLLYEPQTGQCNNKNSSTNSLNGTVLDFDKRLLAKISKNDTFEYLAKTTMISYKATVDVFELRKGQLTQNATWNRQNGIQALPNRTIQAARRYFRIGTTEAIPWTIKKKDPITKEYLKNADGDFVWEGYCIELIEKLANMMEFDYDLVIPEDGEFGVRVNGIWNGLVGDLAKGQTDIAIGALTMTSEREEVIDFVAPYFEQSGILIVMRKPVRKASLFKFMTVLRLEVWLSIVGALTLTGIMIWILDKYSPYSARNNKRMYPYPCREFTLKESFWFALTSFTPQGGGEAPKALSSRTLVAAYWLFVVLMLATFTANLAAFLTVERMQSPVQSLEQLARQSRINYTVLDNSTIHQYFKNMKSAEEKLYQVWKEITLNSTSDQVEYRVWDYPIKEQYGHILQAITQVGPVKTIQEGFQKVIDSESAEFAFIHDSSEIRYEVTQNCNLTEVGEVFAEQPYAIAVQQGSHLQEEISRRILDLQKDRYFESLSSKYWNQSLKGFCPNADDNEGITLESLGGVFIATLFGLALAMVTLAGEVIYYRRRNAKQGLGQPKGRRKSKEIAVEEATVQGLTALQLKPAPLIGFDDKPLSTKPRISHISVYPRPFPFKE
ncbi:PREDICTED: glutamate receptor ionotropic, kainate 1 [Ceratosolen solmsi marchali]|uniref:Glutamate receptor ionotropic, kainate 1 n=1 Tax=Ceratosolen solmsi marchali TaxID=326594 RepID=A0AAJ6YMP5_9HYME|nr:PREDICTED: glutamate receptor ionotropic, kainate 1 [Ceratosolen solmsi marchali]